MSGVMRRLATILVATAVTAACALLPSEFNGEGAPRQAAIVPLKSERPLIALALGGGFLLRTLIVFSPQGIGP